MTTNGNLDIWHINGPVIWHSENSGLDKWHIDGTWTYIITESQNVITRCQIIIC